jgi:hypothetical protein
MSDKPKINLDKEMKMLMVSLSQENPKRVMELVNQIKKTCFRNPHCRSNSSTRHQKEYKGETFRKERLINFHQKKSIGI